MSQPPKGSEALFSPLKRSPTPIRRRVARVEFSSRKCWSILESRSKSDRRQSSLPREASSARSLREERRISGFSNPELSSFRGVDVVGLLPSEFQIVTDYAAAIPANAVHPEAGKALVEFMRSAEGAAAMKAKGLDPK